jgi:hypothetical protein
LYAHFAIASPTVCNLPQTIYVLQVQRAWLSEALVFEQQYWRKVVNLAKHVVAKAKWGCELANLSNIVRCVPVTEK